MAGNLAQPVMSSSSRRAFMFASLIALLIALSQWARWGGFIEWDLLSAASGLAQSAQLRSASLPTGDISNFNCPNLALDPQSPIFSDAQLKAVGDEICNSSTAEAVSLRGTDGSVASAAQASARRANRQARQRPAVVSEVVEKASAARGFTVANFEPARTGNTREILDELERSVRTLDAIDPGTPGTPGTPDSPRPNDNGDHDGSGKDDRDDHHGDAKDDDGHDKDYSNNDSDGRHDSDDDNDGSHGGDDSGDDHDGSYDVAEIDRDDGDHDGDSHDSDDRDDDSRGGDNSDGDDRDDDSSGGDRSGSNSGRH